MPGSDLPKPVVLLSFCLGTAGLALLGGVFWVVMMSRFPSAASRVAALARRGDVPGRSMYVGARVCRDCHPGEAAQHSRSGHARALRPAAESALARWLNGRRVADPEWPGVAWSYSLSDGQLVIERTGEGRSQHYRADFAFGSGHHATTLVTLVDPDPMHPVLLEHRLTYFVSTGSVGVTPGQRRVHPSPGTTPEGSTLIAAKAIRCFWCHSTRTSASDARESTLDPATMIPNVSCERCHGPGHAHVAAARRGAENDELAMVLGPGRWTAEDQMRLCGQCHHHPATERAELIRPDNPAIIRFQPVGLMQSRCYTRIQGGVSCVTCHNPHARTSTDRIAYETACLGCHQVGGRAACPVSPRTGCIDCHMPKRETGQKILFTDHWIRVHPELDTRGDAESAAKSRRE
jgi:hypothetical protein